MKLNLRFHRTLFEHMAIWYTENKWSIKGIIHFEINFWHVLSYLKGIQDVGVFVSTVVSIFIFLGQAVLVCQSYNAGLWSPPQRACTEKSKLNII